MIRSALDEYDSDDIDLKSDARMERYISKRLEMLDQSQLVDLSDAEVCTVLAEISDNLRELHPAFCLKEDEIEAWSAMVNEGILRGVECADAIKPQMRELRVKQKKWRMNKEQSVLFPELQESKT